VKRLFGDRIISRNANIAWPPRPPDLSVCAYRLWGHLKSVVYQTRPTNLDQLKTQIEENIANIPENTLRRAMQNLQNRLTECVQRNGQDLTDVIQHFSIRYTHSVHGTNNHPPWMLHSVICPWSYHQRTLLQPVVRVLGYRSGGPGSIPGITRKKNVVGLERGALSLVSTH
jgi:hypothetical protein